MFKHIIAILLLMVGTIQVFAQYQMVVHTDDGLSYPFSAERIDSVSFVLINPDDNGNDEDETTVTGSATDITIYTATITSWANILDNLSTDLKVGIIFTQAGTPSKNNGTQKTVSTSSLGSDAKYTVTLTGLTPSTTYYYRSFVYQSGIWFYGNVKEFTTKGQGVDLVSGEINKLTCYSAKVSGQINIDEATQYSSLAYGICYGTTAEPTINNSKIQATNKDSEGNFTCQIRALTGSTTYYYRSYAYVDGYLSYGPVRSFTTKADDVVITGDIDSETFTVKSELKIGGGAYSTLELGVCYGTNEHPTVSDKTVTTNEVDDENNFSLTLKDITYRTTYYRSFVKIDGIAHYGETKSFRKKPKENGTENSYQYIELGLSVKWATFNVGASKPEEYGDYFAWGETEPYYEDGYAQENPQSHWKDGKSAGYAWSTYKWCNGSKTTLTKYNTKSDYGTVDNKTTLDPEDDVAHVKWGGSWRMPTHKEQDELRNNCTWTWYSSGNSEFGGVAGYKVTSNKEGYTDRFIFLPAAGYRYGTYLSSVGSYGIYWSSSLRTDGPDLASSIFFYSGTVYAGYSRDRYLGLSVRPVCP